LTKNVYKIKIFGGISDFITYTLPLSVAATELMAH
jgi:hypothetical protein